MTRYTNFGRKRTYLEAGFDNKEPVEEAAPPQEESDVSNERNLTQANKKSKHSKKKNLKENKSDSNIDPGEGSSQETKAEENETVKNAYNNRDKNREMEKLRNQKSEQRRQNRIKEKLATTTCFACREKGHAARDCPKVEADRKSGKEKTNIGICYRCGSSKHSLSRCKKPENPDNPLPYASCFVCSGKGHLASSCPQNASKGIYPNGGNCKLCNETTHLARNCPMRKQDNAGTAVILGTGGDAGADEDDFHTFKRMKTEVDVEEEREKRAFKKADVKVGAVVFVVFFIALQNKTLFAPMSSQHFNGNGGHALREQDKVVIYLSPQQPIPDIVPYELHEHILSDDWYMRNSAIRDMSFNYYKPLFERFYLVVATMSCIILPLILYQIIFNAMFTQGPHTEGHFFEARAVSFAVFIGTILVFWMPILIWKGIGKRRVRKMLADWERADRATKAPGAFVPVWSVKTPSVFKSTCIVSVSIPPNSRPTVFSRNAYLPDYVNPPTDAGDAYYYPYAPGKAGIPRMSVAGTLPAYQAEAGKEKYFEDVKV
ncbi:zf-cchc type zinc finger [Pyrrhoderma noxium]|uniref:Zf-cchc type zinc finger n=1 Tax=Pyrrhoderma noxium TaxID=2282107 RepID=A0A286UFQ2_9AGAM|nr:zf-cchc type zinc finger [Pyrrhoderma noxium]